MSRFVKNDELRKVDLGNGDWVKIPLAVSFKTAMSTEHATDPKKASLDMILACLKEWNFTEDGSDEIAPINEENILRLDVPTIVHLTELVTPLFTSDHNKKK